MSQEYLKRVWLKDGHGGSFGMPMGSLNSFEKALEGALGKG